ncbi:tetratricopeptide repeat protein [Ralstonia solanacearum]|uniref:tetratricopeptide repeat protein n=1 Tax=Ralstonia solanacearum TaxID=305 RepID=UPI0018D008C5|nr:tetratricopeptide repeat protein [Ralstonia solanacearum]
MNSLDDLPKRHGNHATESKAEAAFQKLLSNSKDVLFQGSDRQDYGTDCQIEVIDSERATNVRIHVQLKGTEGAVNADGSVSVEVRRANLNYMLMQPHAFFVCYHVPTDTLRFCSADAVLRRYAHSGQSWTQQQTLTVTFSEVLTDARLKSLAALARSGAALSRDARVAQTTARPEDLPSILKAAHPNLHVPDDKAQAAAMLSSLYDSGADAVISASFEQFAAVLPRDHDAMMFCYMAEINLGMAGRSDGATRVEDGIAFLASKIDAGRHHVGSLHYSMGNGYSALGREEEAVKAYETALRHLARDRDTPLLAECHKNLGSSYEKLGDGQRATESFREALRHNPQLPEAHCALGLHCLRIGEYGEALEHYDQVVFSERMLGKRSSVSGWRINVLFNLGEGKAAFREINTLLSDAADEAWIWPWCARQVASFGRASPENARLSIPFWDRYLKVHPNCPIGEREQLLNRLYLRSEGQAPDTSYVAFKAEFEGSIRHVQGEAVAHLWDRLGHWAQEDDNWEEAERCFRVAYDLAGGHYGYCLGTALNFLDRPDESLPILLPQAEVIQPDDMSWYQVAVAYEKLGRQRESVSAYQKAIELNPNYALAWFNMGGVHWNAGELEEASRVWRAAVGRFPDHELAALLRRDLPFVLG